MENEYEILFCGEYNKIHLAIYFMNKANPVGRRISKWGESPLWYDNKLIYVDIESRTIIFYSPEQDQEEVVFLEERVGFVVPTKEKNFIWGGDNGLYLLDKSSKKSSLIEGIEVNSPNNRFNDGKVSPEGLLFAGTISLVKKPEASLYRLNKLNGNNKVTKVYAPVTNSNGLAWSLDNKLFYYIDTPSQEIKAFNYEPGIGEIDNPKRVVDVSHLDASADGMCIDNKGMLWVAFCHGGCVINFNPKTGKEIRRINLPVLEVTSCCFGGIEGRDLYITTGIHKTRKEEQGGSLFVVKDMDVSAPPASVFGK